MEGVSTRRWTTCQGPGVRGYLQEPGVAYLSGAGRGGDGFLGRPLDGGPYPYLWLDGLTQKVREDGRIVNVSVVVATAVSGEGSGRSLGWTWYQRRRRLLAGLSALTVRQGSERGGSGGIGCASGLRDAIATVFGGASWQRCRTHFMTNLLTRVPRRAQPWVANMVRTIYSSRPLRGPRTARAGDRPATGPVPSGGLSTGRGWCGRPGLLQLPCPPTGRRSGPTTPWSASTRRYGVAPMSWASSLTDQPCVAWLAPSSLNSTTNGPSAVYTRHPRSTAIDEALPEADLAKAVT